MNANYDFAVYTDELPRVTVLAWNDKMLFKKNLLDGFYSDIARYKEIEIFTKLKLLNRQFHLLTLISINGMFLSTHFKRALKRKKGSENVQIIIISGS